MTNNQPLTKYQQELWTAAIAMAEAYDEDNPNLVPTQEAFRALVGRAIEKRSLLKADLPEGFLSHFKVGFNWEEAKIKVEYYSGILETEKVLGHTCPTCQWIKRDK